MICYKGFGKDLGLGRGLILCWILCGRLLIIGIWDMGYVRGKVIGGFLRVMLKRYRSILMLLIWF